VTTDALTTDGRAAPEAGWGPTPGLVSAALVAVLTGIAIAADRWVVVAGILAILVGAIVLAVPREFVVVMIALNASELLVPEPSGQLYVFVLAAIPIIGWRFLDRLWSGRREPWSMSRALIVAFAVLTLAIMAVRGIGFQALGGSKAGGFLYVRLLATAGLALLLPGVRLTDAQWRQALYAMCILAVLPLIADLTAVYVRLLAPAAAALFHLSPSVEGLAFGTTTDNAPFRWFSAGALSAYLTVLLFLRERSQGRNDRLSPAVVVGLITAFAIASFSGHRLAILNVVGITAILMLLDGRLTVRRAVLGAVGLVAFFATLALFADALPVAVQRAISWIPGVQISAEAGRSASDSVTWRLVVWLVALQEIPKYLWIGRGFAYSQSDLITARSAHLMAGEANWAVVQGYFHNGWLSLLILLGVVGLAIGFALLLSIAVRHVRLTRAAWSRPPLQRYHRVLTAWLLLQVASYWLIYGDVQVSFPQLLFTVAILEALRSDDASSDSPFGQTAQSLTNS
jgi:hypothetical protein